MKKSFLRMAMGFLCLLFSMNLLNAQAQMKRALIDHHICGNPADILGSKLSRDIPQDLLENEQLYHDRFGNVYRTSEVQVNAKVQQFTWSTTNGLFELDFMDNGTGFEDATLGAARAQAVQQAFEDISQFLVPASSCDCPSPTNPCLPTVRILIDESFDTPITPNNNVAAYGTSYYNYNVGNGGILHGEVWKAINTGENLLLGGQIYHGVMGYNFHDNLNWHLGAIPSTNPNTIDLYTTTMHEIFHMLGFTSAVEDDQGVTNNNYFSPWDQLISNVSGGAPMVQSLSGTGYYDMAINPAFTQFEAGCNEVVIDNGTTTLPIHAPASFLDGRSFSHLDNSCSSTFFLMHPFQNLNSPRAPSAEEVALLCSLGYETDGSFGSGLYASQNYASCGTRVAAIPDGNGDHCSLTYTTDACTPIDILYCDLIANDVGNDLDIEFESIEIVSGDGTLATFGNNGNGLNCNGGNTPGITFTPIFPGLMQIRYTVINDDGTRGNFALIDIRVYPCLENNCTNTDPCNLVCNGEIDDLGTCPATSNGTCSSPSGFGSQCLGLEGWFEVRTSVDFFCSVAGGRPPLLDNDNGYFHLFSNAGICSESAAINVDIQPNQEYILSFYGNSDSFWDPIEIFRASFLDEDEMDEALDCTTPFSSFEGFVGEDLESSTGWEHVVHCFSFTEMKSFLMFSAAHTAGNPSGRFYFDNVVVIQDDMTGGVMDIDCNESVVLGQELCEVPSTTYEWYEGDAQGNLITDGILGDDGEMLEVSPSSTTDYVLVRTIGANTINCATTEVTFTVNVDGGVDAGFTAEDAGCALSMDFVGSDNPNEYHTWDFGDGSTAEGFVEDGGHIVSHIYPASNTYTVTHTVSLNGCTATESIDITLSGTGGGGWPFIQIPSTSYKNNILDIATNDTNNNLVVGGAMLGGESVEIDGNTITSVGQRDVFIAMYNDCGELLWIRNSVGPNRASIRQVEFASDGSVFAIISVDGTTNIEDGSGLTSFTGSLMPVLLKYDQNGNLLWSARIENSGFGASFSDILPIPNGGAYVAGSYSSGGSIISGTTSTPLPSTSNFSDRMLIRFDVNGNIDLLETQLQNTSRTNSIGYLEYNNDGDILIFGGQHEPLPTNHAILMLYDTQAETVIATTTWGDNPESFNWETRGLAVDANNNVLVSGLYYPDPNNPNAPGLVNLGNNQQLSDYSYYYIQFNPDLSTPLAASSLVGFNGWRTYFNDNLFLDDNGNPNVLAHYNEGSSHLDFLMEVDCSNGCPSGLPIATTTNPSSNVDIAIGSDQTTASSDIGSRAITLHQAATGDVFIGGSIDQEVNFSYEEDLGSLVPSTQFTTLTSTWATDIYIARLQKSTGGSIFQRQEGAPLASQINAVVSPNPNNGIFNLDLVMNQGQYANIEVLDINGKKVRKISEGHTVTLNTTIDLSDMAGGIYFLTIQTAKEVKTIKIVSLR